MKLDIRFNPDDRYFEYRVSTNKGFFPMFYGLCLQHYLKLWQGNGTKITFVEYKPNET